MTLPTNDRAALQSRAADWHPVSGLFRLDVDLHSGHIAILFSLLALSAIAAEYDQYVRQGPVRTFFLPILGILIIVASLLRITAALLNRLLFVIRENTAAQKGDLYLIAFAYFSVIVGFGTIYLFLENLAGKPIFRFSPYVSSVRLVDNLYMSGVTITTVGYGDIVPVFWFAKLLLVLESLIGIALTGTVLGFFIGSLLSFQQQDQQRKWYAGIQRLYFEALDDYSQAVNSIDFALDLQELRKKTLETRQGILKIIASLVQAQYAPSPSAKVSANWMRLYVGAEAAQDYLDLAQEYASPLLKGAGMKTIWGILVLREWGEKPANMPAYEELALPVYDPNDLDKVRNQLAGAPAAVTSTDGYYVVPDTHLIDLDNQDEIVRAKMERYFQDHKSELRSFASVRIDYSGRILGVVNIQSSEPNLFGTTEYVQRIIVDMIRPFARYLAQLIAYDEAKEKDK